MEHDERLSEAGQSRQAEFVAIDVETANADVSSICQVGLALFRDGRLVEEWKSHVDPEDYFDPVNISIHGIDEAAVEGAPRMPDLTGDVYRFMDGRIAVCHTHFDRVSLQRVSAKYGLRQPDCVWLDSARVVRRSWEKFAWSGYGLGSVCKFLGYEFAHHDALEDAKAAGHVLIAAMRETGLSLEAWIERVDQPIEADRLAFGGRVERDGSPDGPLYGEVLVFTGALSMPRLVAAEMAARVGCRVDAGVTKKTTILVVGDQDVRLLGGQEKSAKHRKAELLISQGRSIRILRESDFEQIATSG